MDRPCEHTGKHGLSSVVRFKTAQNQALTDGHMRTLVKAYCRSGGIPITRGRGGFRGLCTTCPRWTRKKKVGQRRTIHLPVAVYGLDGTTLASRLVPSSHARQAETTHVVVTLCFGITSLRSDPSLKDETRSLAPYFCHLVCTCDHGATGTADVRSQRGCFSLPARLQRGSSSSQSLSGAEARPHARD